MIRTSSLPQSVTGDTEMPSNDAVAFHYLETPRHTNIKSNASSSDPLPLQPCPRPQSPLLSTVTLLALSYFIVGSGPEGGEAMIIAAGPRLGLGVLVLFPLVYFFPMAFLVTELVGAIPQAGGHAYWIALAFGPAWGLQAGFWAWVGNCTHCATYASIGITSLYRVAGWKGMPVLEYTARAGLSMVLATPSFFHLRVVSYAAGSLIVFIFIPYIFIALWSAMRAESWDKLGEMPDTAMISSSPYLGYGNLVTALAWNFNGFQNLSVFATCVQDPRRTFRRVLILSLSLIPLSYLVPVLPLIALSYPDWTTWAGPGSAIYAAGNHLGGTYCTLWITIVSIVCNAGLYIGCLLCSVFLACGMAEKDFAPFSLQFAGLVRPNLHGIDHSVLFCSLAIILIAVTCSIKDLILISNALSGLETMVLVAAAVRLRITRPELPRTTAFGRLSYMTTLAILVVPFGVSGFVFGWAFTMIVPAAMTTVFLFSGIIYGLHSDLTNFRRTYEPVRTILD